MNMFKVGQRIGVNAYQASLEGVVTRVEGNWVIFTITDVALDKDSSTYEVGSSRQVDYRQCFSLRNYWVSPTHL